MPPGAQRPSPGGTLRTMSRGLGQAQRTILATLADDADYALTTANLAERLGRSQRQIRTAVDALERRGLVVVTRGHVALNGERKYGKVTRQLKETPGSVLVRKVEPWPTQP